MPNNNLVATFSDLTADQIAQFQKASKVELGEHWMTGVDGVWTFNQENVPDDSSPLQTMVVSLRTDIRPGNADHVIKFQGLIGDLSKLASAAPEMLDQNSGTQVYPLATQDL